MNAVAESAMVQAIVIASVTGGVIAVGLYVWYALALSRLFPRLGVEGWKGWVPILNEATILTLGGKPAWGVIFFFIPILQLYGLYLKIVATHSINQRFGRGAGSTALAVLLPPVWATLLAWGTPPYPEGDRLAGLPGLPRQHQPGQGVDAAHRSSYLAPPILPPGAPTPPAPGGAPSSYAPAPTAVFPAMPPAPLTSGSPAPQIAPASFAPAPGESFAPSEATPSGLPAPEFGVPAPAPAPFYGAPPAASPAPPSAPPAPEVAVDQLIDSVPGFGTRAPAAPAAPPAETAAPAAELVAPVAERVAPVVEPAAPVVEPATPFVEPAAPVAEPAPPSVEHFAPPAGPAAPPPQPTSPARSERVPGIRPAPVPLPVPDAPAASAATAHPSALGTEMDDTVIVARAHADDAFEETVVVARRRGVRRVLVLDDGRRFALSATSIVIGRNPDGGAGEQQLSIPDKTRTLSKTHARLVVQGDEWRLTDLDSTNGVVVVADDGAETLLEPGESVIGAGRFLLGEVGMHVAVEANS